VTEAQRAEAKSRGSACPIIQGEHWIEADGFVDASGDCDLARIQAGRLDALPSNGGAVNLGTLRNLDLAAFAADADISAESVARGRFTQPSTTSDRSDRRGLTKDKSVIARLPISGERRRLSGSP